MCAGVQDDKADSRTNEGSVMCAGVQEDSRANG